MACSGSGCQAHHRWGVTWGCFPRATGGPRKGGLGLVGNPLGALIWGWEGSGAKSKNGRSSREPGLDTQHPDCGSWLTICNSSSRGSNTLFWLREVLSTHKVHTHKADKTPINIKLFSSLSMLYYFDKLQNIHTLKYEHSKSHTVWSRLLWSLTSTLMAHRPMALTALRTKSTSTSVAYSFSSARTCQISKWITFKDSQTAISCLLDVRS